MARGRHTPSLVTWDDINNDEDPYPDSDPDFFNIQILSEGDSWFTVGGFPVSNVLYQLRFHEPAIIINLAFPGDTLIHMAKLSKNPDLKQALGRQSLDWDAILLSGGGNDLVEGAADVLLSPTQRGSARPAHVESYCDSTGLTELIDSIKQGYRSIAALRDKPGSRSNGTPIVTHTYSYVTPRPSPTRVFGIGLTGPWLYTAFTEKEIPGADWLKLAEYLIDTLAEGLQSLSNEIDDFHVVDTRRVLTRAGLGTSGDDADWLNEIHPNSEGYAKLAKAIEPVLQRLIR